MSIIKKEIMLLHDFLILSGIRLLNFVRDAQFLCTLYKKVMKFQDIYLAQNLHIIRLEVQNEKNKKSLPIGFGLNRVILITLLL